MSSQIQSPGWAFTLYPTLTETSTASKQADRLIERFAGDPTVDCWVFQGELCPETKRFHWQGYVRFKTKRGRKAVQALVEYPTGHCKPAKGTPAQNKTYCTKEESRAAGPWMGGSFPKEVSARRPVDVITVLRPWQRRLEEALAQAPDSREILWVWDEDGNTGKTAMAKYLVNQGETLYVNGQSKDIKSAVASWFNPPAGRAAGGDLRTVVMGLARQTASSGVSYKALEEIKDGLFFSGKYESGMVMMATPHVVVFANFPPQLDALSPDRWRVVCLDTDPLGVGFPLWAVPAPEPSVRPPVISVPPGPPEPPVSPTVEQQWDLPDFDNSQEWASWFPLGDDPVDPADRGEEAQGFDILSQL